MWLNTKTAASLSAVCWSVSLQPRLNRYIGLSRYRRLVKWSSLPGFQSSCRSWHGRNRHSPKQMLPTEVEIQRHVGRAGCMASPSCFDDNCLPTTVTLIDLPLVQAARSSLARTDVVSSTFQQRPGLTITRLDQVSGDYITQPCEHTALWPANCLANVMGCHRRTDGRAEMTVARDLVQLSVGQFEESLRFTVTVVFQSTCSED